MPAMDPQRDLKHWVRVKLDERGHGARTALARELGVTPDAVTRMTRSDAKKETREIKAHELTAIVRFFGEQPPKLFHRDEESIPSDLVEKFMKLRQESPDDAEEALDIFSTLLDRRAQKIHSGK